MKLKDDCDCKKEPMLAGANCIEKIIQKRLIEAKSEERDEIKVMIENYPFIDGDNPPERFNRIVEELNRIRKEERELIIKLIKQELKLTIKERENMIKNAHRQKDKEYHKTYFGGWTDSCDWLISKIKGDKKEVSE